MTAVDATQPAATATQILEAGGMVPGVVKSVGDLHLDTLGARTYHHAALGERVVVRLVPDALAPAEDLALDFLGFTVGSSHDAIATTRRQALGFPAWALVHDPTNAAYALDVVKEMERYARLAKSKPGAAKDGYDTIAERLGRSVPQFLPSFYEEAGRAFVATGNNKMAATMFSKARLAEQTYGLAVDEDRRRDAFLEFAFAGALTAKALDEYAKQLEQQFSADEAYTYYRNLVVQRTLGGLPPAASTVPIVQRLAKAAGLDVQSVLTGMLDDLLDSPATRLAPLGFWKPMRATLIRAAKDSPAVRGRLLNLFPTASGMDEWWFELLHDSGATATLTAMTPGADPEAEPAGGPAAWLSRAIKHVTRGWLSDAPPAALLTLMVGMAPRLVADGVPVDVVSSRAYNSELELVEHTLAAGIPVVDPSDGRPPVNFGFNFYMWFRRPAAQRSHLEAIAADERFAGTLQTEAVQMLGGDATYASLTAVRGLRSIVERHLGSTVEQLSTAALLGVGDAARFLEKAATPAFLAGFPEERDRARRAAVGHALARTLRGGLIDEFWWPSLHDAVAELPAGAAIHVEPEFPYAVVAAASKVRVAGPDGVLHRSDVRGIKAEVTQCNLRFSQGQVFVGSLRYQDNRGYWSGAPNDQFEPKGLNHVWNRSEIITSVELPDGTRTYGGRAVHAGDTELGQLHMVMSDGTTYWRQEYADGDIVLREFDPTTGELGRRSLPAFLEDRGDQPGTLRVSASSLLPAPPAVAASPLGQRDGLVGCRVTADGPTWYVTGIDGRSFAGSLGQGVARRGVPASPVGLVMFPGADRPRVLADSGNLHLFDETGRMELARVSVGSRRPDMAEGTQLVLPPVLWHNLRPRDVDASIRLRSITDTDGDALLAAAQRDRSEGHSRTNEMTRTRQVVANLMGARADETLVTAVVARARAAARIVDKIAATTAEAAAAPTDVVELTPVTDDVLGEALAGLVPGSAYRRTTQASAVAQILAVGEWMDQGAPPKRGLAARLLKKPAVVQEGAPSAPPSDIAWQHLTPAIGAVAMRAASPFTSDDHRAHLVTLLRAWARSPFGTHAAEFRYVKLQETDRAQAARVNRPTHQFVPFVPFIRSDGHRWFGTTGFNYGRISVDAVERAHDGEFAVAPDHSVAVQAHNPDPWGTADRLNRFLDLLDANGPMTWDPESVATLRDRTGLTTGEAALLLATTPAMDTWEHNFLPKEVREGLGLKTREAATARDRLRDHGHLCRLLSFDGAMPADPAELWADGAMVRHAERLAEVWVARHGVAVSIPEEVATATAKLVSRQSRDVLTAFADPSGTPSLHTDGVWQVGSWSVELAPSSPKAPFGGDTAVAATLLAAWLTYERPVGDPLRLNVPAVVDLARQRLDNPELVVQAGDLDLGGSPEALGARRTGPTTFEMGIFVFRVYEHVATTRAFFRPALLPSASEAELALLASVQWSDVAAVLYLRSDAALALAAEAARTDLPPGTVVADPTASVPHLVDRVASAHGLDADAAALYLQLLALPDPTKKRVTTVNGWTPKRYSTAAAAVVEAGLAITAKRARAGRDIFLPGGWIDLKAPSLPIEQWKVPMFAASPGGEVDPLGAVVPLRPLGDLFAEAVHRIESGDVPAFEAATRGRR